MKIIVNSDISEDEKTSEIKNKILYITIKRHTHQVNIRAIITWQTFSSREVYELIRKIGVESHRHRGRQTNSHMTYNI